VNIDYILELVEKYRESNNKDTLITIDKAINSSIQLRNKKGLIEDFIHQINTSTKVYEDWHKFINECKERDISAIIKEEKLDSEKTKRLIGNAFRDGKLKTTGTAIDDIMPPISRFNGSDRDVKKQNIIEKLLNFFDKYFGLV
jgi:type I restriction enzyme R subunit